MARFLMNRIALIKLYPQNFILKRSRIVRSTLLAAGRHQVVRIKTLEKQEIRGKKQEAKERLDFFASWRLCARKKKETRGSIK